MRICEKLAPHWPPAWAAAIAPAQKVPTGEDGVLAAVHTQRDQQTGEDYLVLENDYEGSRHSGVLLVPHSALRAKVLEVLQANIGHPIRAIGSLEI